jgi:tetratricopeptide (TPR) repeat protein
MSFPTNHHRFLRNALGGVAAIVCLSACGSGLALTFESEASAWEQARSQGAQAVKSNNYSLAEQKYADAVRHARKLEATSPGHVGVALAELGDVYVAENKPEKAETTYLEALQAFKEMQGLASDSLSYKTVGLLNQAKTQLALAGIFANQNKLAEAESMYKQAMDIRAHGIGAASVFREAKKQYVQLLVKQGRDKEADRLTKLSNPMAY